jgi:apolipoprotein D and lipocalin family protein
MRVGEVAAALVRDYGVWNALNLDGGGSTSLAMRDPATGVARLVNTSSDNPAGRLVASSLAVFARPRQAPGGPVHTVPAVDLDRYLGKWFEIARFDNRFQRVCAGEVTAEYSRRPDGRIDVINRCRRTDGTFTTAAGVARIVDTVTRAKLKVRFAPAFLSWIPAVWGDYWVIGLADDYSWAVVGSPDRQYLWVLSRTPAMTPAQYKQAIDVVRANGFDDRRLALTAQAPKRPEF